MFVSMCLVCIVIGQQLFIASLGLILKMLCRSPLPTLVINFRIILSEQFMYLCKLFHAPVNDYFPYILILKGSGRYKNPYFLRFFVLFVFCIIQE